MDGIIKCLVGGVGVSRGVGKVRLWFPYNYSSVYRHLSINIDAGKWD